MFWYKVEERSKTRLVLVSSEANQKNTRGALQKGTAKALLTLAIYIWKDKALQNMPEGPCLPVERWQVRYTWPSYPPFCSPPGEALGHTVMQFSPPAIQCNPFLNVKEQKTYSPDFQPCLLSSTFLGTNTSNLDLNVGSDKTANICP